MVRHKGSCPSLVHRGNHTRPCTCGEGGKPLREGDGRMILFVHCTAVVCGDTLVVTSPLLRDPIKITNLQDD